MHKNNVVHRDIKPENIMLEGGDTALAAIKIIDFGTATKFTRGKGHREKLGTFSYMAPEIMFQKTYNEKVDMWSLGIILYEMFTL